MKNKIPTIKEVGLEKWLKQKGIDYDEFCKRDDLQEPDAIIARALSKDLETPLDRRTVAYWREIRKKEQKNA